MKKTILFPQSGKTTKRKFLFMRLFTASLLLMLSTISWAYDFKVDGIFYYITTDNRNVWVTYSNSEYYKGNVVIPSTVSYNNITYNVTGIDNSAFAYCSDLTSVQIPNSVTFIGNTAFYGCSKLTGICIPNSVTQIASRAFDGCPLFRGVVCLAETPPSNSNAFSSSTLNMGWLTVPASAIDKYKAADPWNKFATFYTIANTIKISIGSDGLTTYCPTLSISSSYDYYIDFTKLEDKIAAYKATIDGNVVNLTRTYKVGSSEGVLLRSLDGGAVDETLTVELIEKAAKKTGSDEEANAFVGVKTDTYLNETDDEGNTNFVLSKQEDGTIGFYKVKDNTLVKAGKAYLPVPIGDAADVKGLTLAFDDATGIIGVPPLQESEGDDAFYTLSGVRVANPTAKGIYIHNGKKVIIK